MPYYTVVLKNEDGHEMPVGLSASFKNAVDNREAFIAELLLQFSEADILPRSANGFKSFEVYEGSAGKRPTSELGTPPVLSLSRKELRDLQRSCHIHIGIE